MKRISDRVLQVGDIVLTTTNELTSRSIRAASTARTKSKIDVSHAMICVDHCSVIDANAEGVQARNTQRLFYDDNCAIYILRPSVPLTDNEMEALCTYVRARIGTQYTKKEAARLLKGGSNHSGRRQFCSRLVAQAYASIGRPLVPNADYCWPDDFKGSAHLSVVPDPTEAVTEEEYRRWQRNVDMTAKMREVTNAVLAGARKKNAKIEDLNDIIQHLIRRPGDDAYFANLYLDSGYLTLWREEMAKNLWRYDINVMRASGIPDSQLDEYCRSAIGSLRREERYQINKIMSLKLASQHGLETFWQHYRLYDTLAENQMKRFQTAMQWQRLRTGAPVPDPRSTPHSAEWFAALEEWHPYQALIARTAVAKRKRDDVCSVCGDDPSAIYCSAGEPAPGEVQTLRLCDDCRKLRADQFGEIFEPFSPAP